MKRLAVFLLIGLCGCGGVQPKLAELDRALERKDAYLESYESRSSALKEALAEAQSDSTRWSLSHELFEHYLNVSIDSAEVYLSRMGACCGEDPERECFTALYSTKVDISRQNYRAVERTLDALDPATMSEAARAEYYNAKLVYYSIAASDETIPKRAREEFERMRYVARQEYLSCSEISEFEKIRRPAISLYEDGRPELAIPVLERLVESSSDSLKAHAAYSLAKAWEVAGSVREQKYWFAQSSIYSILRPCGEHLALYELSILLYNEGKFRRASLYSRESLEEALACGYNTRALSSAASQQTIIQAVERRQKFYIAAWIGLSVVLALLFGLAVFLWQKGFVQRRELRRLNARLEETSKIKDAYVSRYIRLSAGHLKVVEEYRHDLRVTLREEGEAALKEKLRRPEIENLDREGFYRTFDETFTGIFPDFLGKVNSLLKPEARLCLKENGDFPTALRILAALKLGITDSGKIAEFLGCAPSSVYTHRSKIKAAARCAPEDFERLICE